MVHKRRKIKLQINDSRFLFYSQRTYCVEYILVGKTCPPYWLPTKNKMKVSMRFPCGTVIMVFFLLPYLSFFFFFLCKEEKAPMETYQGDVRSMQRMSIVREKAECGSLLSLRGEG